MGPQLAADPDRAGGWLLTVDGVAQSYVDTTDPGHLELGYVATLGAVCDSVVRPGPVRALHLGTGAATLARFLAAGRPGSAQVLVDADPEVVALVGDRLGWPAGCTVVVADGRAALTGAAPCDLVLVDAFSGSRAAASLVSVEALSLAASVLAGGGVWAANLADSAPYAFTRSVAAAAGEAFAEVAVLAEPGVLRGRRFGNVVLVAAGEPFDPAPLVRAAAGLPFPVRVLHGASLAEWVGGAAPLTDSSRVSAPVPSTWGLGARLLGADRA